MLVGSHHRHNCRLVRLTPLENRSTATTKYIIAINGVLLIMVLKPPDSLISQLYMEMAQTPSVSIEILSQNVSGYGDMIPLSTLGKCMGSFAVFCGLIIIALPATIIVTRFSEEYERTKMQNELNPCASVAM